MGKLGLSDLTSAEDNLIAHWGILIIYVNAITVLVIAFSLMYFTQHKKLNFHVYN